MNSLVSVPYMKEEINRLCKFILIYRIKCDIFTFSTLTRNFPVRPETVDITEKLSGKNTEHV